MAVSVRQNYLFAAEDYRIAYESFSNANFKSYDYDGIRNALIDYIRNNYPENYNDWIESSEFVAILDLIAYVGHSYAFRVDLDSRENFLATAEGRANVLRLARQLGYTPNRCIPAQGLLKISSIKTNQVIYNSENENLSGKIVSWEDLNDENAYNNFITIINEVMTSTNKFGDPYKSGSVDGILTQTYRVNSDLDKEDIVKRFSATVLGNSETFEIINPDFTDKLYFYEKDPNPDSSFDLIYRNDSNGLSSINTGFFLMFKQGNLNNLDVLIEDAIENRVVDLDITNINENDIWVQSISNDGTVTDNWTKVDNLVGNSVIYNNINRGIRKIFQVITGDNDTISVKFANGQYGDIPVNLLRFWYRTSLNETYLLHPDDVQDIEITIPYIGVDGSSYNAIVTANLEYTVTSATATESLESIKFNAPLVYSSQNRMITDQDYSVYPLSISSAIVKAKSINRTHSGHSRYFDLYDPTGTYNNLNIFGEDAYIYEEYVARRKTLSTSSTLTSRVIMSTIIKDLLEDANTRNFYYEKYNPVGTALDRDFLSAATSISWSSVSTTNANSTGFFAVPSSYDNTTNEFTIAKEIGETTNISPYMYLRIGTIIRFVLPKTDDGLNLDWTNDTREVIYAKVVSIQSKGLGVFGITNNEPSGKDRLGNGVVALSENIPNGSRIDLILPPLTSEFESTLEDSIINALNAQKTFGLRFNWLLPGWEFIDDTEISSKKDSFSYPGPSVPANDDASWLLRIEVVGDIWEIVTRQLRYVIGSETDVRFFNQNFNRISEKSTKKPKQDILNILKINDNSTGTGTLNTDFKFNIIDYFTSSDGYTDPTKVIVVPADQNLDLIPDNPYAFRDLVASNLIYFRQETTNDRTFNFISEDITDIVKSGRANLKFNWKHYVEDNDTVDPSPSNIIDMYLLTDNYNKQYRSWLKNDGKSYTMPLPPTSLELSALLTGINDVKATSDLIVYKSAELKPLFGDFADPELQANIKVVKIPGANYSDNEIKSLIVNALEEYFDVKNWDFGETFYWTELSAYLHQELSGIIATAVIVPIDEASSFGKLFQISCESNELFVNCATVKNVFVVDSINDLILRAV